MFNSKFGVGVLKHPGYNDIGSIFSAGASIVGGLLGADASENAAETQAAAANRAADLQYKMFKENQAAQKPFLEAGYKGQNRLLDLLALSGNTGAQGYGSAARNFGMSDFEQDPGYAFRMSEGLKALDRTAAARGGMLSGAALKGSQRYGQDLASQEYQNAYNRYQTNRANQLNPLQSLAGQGQTTANTLGAAGQNYATSAGEAYMGAGNARASGYMGSANAWQNALGGAASAYNKYAANKMPIGGANNSFDMLPDSNSFDYYYNMSSQGQ
jgi:hypothetical protein